MGEILIDGPVTVTFVDPITPEDGSVAVMVVDEFTVNAWALWPPNVTEDAALKLLPAIVTTVPPAVEPTAGLTPVTTGPWLFPMYVNW